MPDGVQIITEQPEGELRIYSRSGFAVTDNGEGSIITDRQTGLLSVVFADNGVVYLEDPVSGYAWNCWVEGSLSADGTTITLPVGQYIDYLRTFDIGTILAVLDYDDNLHTYVMDASTTAVTYTIEGETIRLNGTNEDRILGTVYRPFSSFPELDGQWQGVGDFESTYEPFAEALITPPGDAYFESSTFNTSIFDGVEWTAFSTPVTLATAGSDVYLQGVTTYCSKGWIKGTRDGDRVTFPTGQFIGTSNGAPFYVLGGRLQNGNIVNSDITFTIDASGTYTSTDYIFITTEKTEFVYVVYYLGTTITNVEDQLVVAPDQLDIETYTLDYGYLEQNAMNLLQDTKFVKVGFSGDEVYVKGLWEEVPDAWVKGTIAGKKVSFSTPQYLGKVDNGYGLTYPFYLISFDTESGILTDGVQLDYDAATGTMATDPLRITSQQRALGISINKTSFLAVSEFYNPIFRRFNEVVATPASPTFDDFFLGDESGGEYALVSIKATDTAGQLLNPEKVGYRFYLDTEHDIVPFTLTPDRFDMLTEPMTTIPYLFTDSDEGYDIILLSDGQRKVFFNRSMDEVNRVGVETVYTGGGEERCSPIVWLTLRDFTGITSPDLGRQTVVAEYDVQGRRVGTSARGLVIRQTIDAQGQLHTTKALRR